MVACKSLVKELVAASGGCALVCFMSCVGPIISRGDVLCMKPVRLLELLKIEPVNVHTSQWK